jgi:hypothetical protein
MVAAAQARRGSAALSDVERKHFKRAPADDWTLERIAQLSVRDIKQLRENAERLHEAGVAALCSEALRIAPPQRRAHAARRSGPRIKARRLIARANAFETRGVWLQDRRTSWSGVRKSDGAVVMALWADSIHSAAGGCSCLLWAPNLDGSRPWSDQPAGRERLEHCKRAITQGQAEGLLVYGELLDGYLPEDKACAVHGVDPETVVLFRVEMRGAEFWATWGRKAPSSMQRQGS